MRPTISYSDDDPAIRTTQSTLYLYQLVMADNLDL